MCSRYFDHVPTFRLPRMCAVDACLCTRAVWVQVVGRPSRDSLGVLRHIRGGMAPGLFAAARKRRMSVKQDTEATKQPPSGRKQTTKEKVHKRTIERIVEHLDEFPDQAPGVLLALENGDFEDKAVDEASFPAKMSKCSQIPKYWLAGLVNAWQPKLTKALLEKLDSSDADSIRRICEFSTGVDFRSWRLPRSALDKAVLGTTLRARYSAYGSRLSDSWCSLAIRDGNLNWMAGGVYRWVKAEGQEVATAVETVNGIQASLPKDCAFTTTALIAENWSDTRASLRSGWRLGGDKDLFKTNKFAMSSNQTVFALECDEFARQRGTASGASGSAVGAGGGGNASAPRASAAAPTITEKNTTIGKGRKTAKQPSFSPSTASLVMRS